MERINEKDRQILREIAKRHLEYANSQKNEEILKKWDALANGRRETPTVRLLFWNFGHEVIDPRLRCEGELARKIEVNPNTIQRAYREMEILELVETRRGMGTFIKEDESMVITMKIEMDREAVSRFLEEMNSLGYTEAEIVKFINNELVNIKKDKEN